MRSMHAIAIFQIQVVSYHFFKVFLASALNRKVGPPNPMQFAMLQSIYSAARGTFTVVYHVAAFGKKQQRT